MSKVMEIIAAYLRNCEGDMSMFAINTENSRRRIEDRLTCLDLTVPDCACSAKVIGYLPAWAI